MIDALIRTRLRQHSGVVQYKPCTYRSVVEYIEATDLLHYKTVISTVQGRIKDFEKRGGGGRGAQMCAQAILNMISKQIMRA